MSAPSVLCPKCKARVRPVRSGSSHHCPHCEARIRSEAPTKRPPAEEDEDDRPERLSRGESEEIAQRPRKRRPEPIAEEEDEPRPRRKERPATKSYLLPLILGGIAVFALAFVAGGGVLAWALLSVKPAAIDKAPIAAGGPIEAKLKDKDKDGPVARGLEATWVDDSQGEALPLDGERPHLVLDAAGHTATVRRALFTPDGKQVVTVSYDKTVRVWDARSGETIRTFRLPVGPANEGSLVTAALSPDGSRLAVAASPVGNAAEFPLFVIDLAKGRVERVLRGHRNSVSGLEFSRDGDRLVSASSDQTVRVHDVKTGQTKNLLKFDAGLINARFSPDGTRVLTASRDGTARVITLDDERTAHTLAGADQKWAAVRAVAWSRDGSALATASEDGLVRIWNRDGKKIQEVNLTQQHKTNVTLGAVVFNGDGSEVLYGGVNGGGLVGILDVKTGEHRLKFDKHPNTVMDVELSPDGKLAVTTGGNDHDTYVWDASNGEVVQHLKGLGHSGWGVAWSADGKHVAFGDENRGVQGKRRLTGTFHLDRFGVGGPMGKYVSVLEKLQTRPDRVVSLEDARDLFTLKVLLNGKQVAAFRSPIKGERLYCWTLLPGERMIVGGAYAGYLVDLALDDPKQMKILRRFTGHSGIFLGVANSPDFKYFVTGSTDQTLCFWRADQDKPLMSVFVAQSEWIAWTREGYYACSANGERLMGWQINQGTEQVGTFHPAARFRRSLYNPAALAQVLPAGGVQAALAKLGQAQMTNVTQVLPPEVDVTSPAKALRQAHGKVEVTAEAKSVGGNSVTQLRLLVNGRPFEGEKGVRAVANPKPGKVRATWSVDLPPGPHVLSVLAESAVSKGLSVPVVVENTTADDSAPALFVLAVGVADYPGDMKLQFAASDALAIVAALQKHNNGAFREIQSKILTDRQATRTGVVEGLAWLAQKMTPRDVAIVFLSGHGTRDERGNFCFVPADVDERDVAGSCISGEALKKALGNLPGRVVAVFDACHSGAAAEKRVVGRTDDLARDLVTEDYGIVCMCSSLGHEYSLESPETKAGFFTLALVEGLAGRADLNRDTTVYLHELAFYARLRVRQLSRGLQNPTIGRPDSFRPFPMSKPR